MVNPCSFDFLKSDDNVSNHASIQKRCNIEVKDIGTCKNKNGLAYLVYEPAIPKITRQRNKCKKGEHRRIGIVYRIKTEK